VKAPDGAEREEAVARSGYTDIQGSKPFRFTMLESGVAYLSLDHFSNADGLKAFEAALPQILQSKGLVLDMREHQGGSGGVGFQILTYLTHNPVAIAISRQRADAGAMRGSAIRWHPMPGSGVPMEIARDRHFDGPVAVLIGPETISAGEDFLVAFELARRGITVGEPTAGSTGQPMMLNLPGGGTARICVKRDTWPDGRDFVGKGIAPTIAASQTVEDFRAGKDVVLDRAVAALLAR
jgi:C-terminal processing protease CtpA/Prc